METPCTKWGDSSKPRSCESTDEEDGFWLYEQLSDGQNHWWVKGARLHNPKCMAAYGQFLYWGPVNRSKGCAVDEELGQFYLYQAAANVDLAAYTIGFAVLSRDILIDQRSHKDNMRYYDFPTEERIKWFSKTNLDEAKYWLKKVVHGECEHKIMRIDRADMLDAHFKLKEIEEHEKSNGE